MKSRALSSFLAMAALTLAAAPAVADVSARYETEQRGSSLRMEMMLEIDSGGNMRVQMGAMPMYMLMLGSDMYMVARGPTGVYVVRIEDFATVAREFIDRMESVRDMPDGTADPEAEQQRLVALGQREVNGRTGTAYGAPAHGDTPEYVQFVISDDPSLAPIGAAFVRSLVNSTETASRMIPGFGNIRNGLAPEMELLNRGAPLTMASMSLTDVSLEEIDDSRFALPAEPLTIDQIRAQYETFEAAPTLPRREN